MREVNSRVQVEDLPLVHGNGRDWIMNQFLSADDTAPVAV